MMQPLTEAQLARFYAAPRCLCGEVLTLQPDHGDGRAFTCKACGRMGLYYASERAYEYAKGAA